MSEGYNKVMLLGTVTKEPEYKATDSGWELYKFTLAVEREKDDNGKVWNDWFNCVYFVGDHRDFPQEITNDSVVFVEGRLSIREARTGGTFIEISASQVRCLQP